MMPLHIFALDFHLGTHLEFTRSGSTAPGVTFPVTPPVDTGGVPQGPPGATYQRTVILSGALCRQ
jgi:hypothetical protein